MCLATPNLRPIAGNLVAMAGGLALRAFALFKTIPFASTLFGTALFAFGFCAVVLRSDLYRRVQAGDSLRLDGDFVPRQ